MATISGIVVPTGTQATGRRTLLDIVDELSRPVDASDTTVRAIAGDAFRAAVRKLNRKGLWPWEIQDEDISITQDQPFITIVTAIKKPIALHYLNAVGGTRDQPLNYISYDRFLEKYTLDITGQSYLYTIPNLFETGQIRLFPIPSADDNARFSFYRVTPAPKTEQETIEVPDYVLETYVSFAWVEFLKRLPSAQRPFPISVALSEQQNSFRELCSHVNTPGDRSRRVSLGGYGIG